MKRRSETESKASRKIYKKVRIGVKLNLTYFSTNTQVLEPLKKKTKHQSTFTR
jgi:hypothetical protein